MMADIGFYRNFKYQFGNYCYKNLHLLNKLSVKRAKYHNRLFFLYQCKHFSLNPKFLINSTTKSTYNYQNLNSKANNAELSYMRRKLNLEIEAAHAELRFINKLRTNIINEFMDILPIEVYQYILYNNNAIYFKEKNKNFVTVNKKLDSLKKKHASESILNNIKANCHNWIINLSNLHIDEDILAILALGPNFNFKQLNKSDIQNLILDTYTNISLNIDKSNLANKEDIKNKISKFLNSSFFKIKRQTYTYEERELEIAFNNTKKFITQNKDKIVVVKSDKISKTVIMDRNTYNTKAEEILNDESTYQIVKKKPIHLIDNKCKTLLKKIDKPQLIIQNPSLGKMYMLPKIHKASIPLRQITSTINTSTYKLAKFLSNILKNVTSNSETIIKNSFDLVKDISKLNCPNNYKLISFDVTALYPSLPQDLVLELIKNKWCLISEFTDLSLKHFLECISLCFESSVFTYDNKIYKQIEGCPMGNSLSGFLAEIVLQDLETDIINKYKSDVIYYKRYVDDCFLIIKEQEINNIFNKFNEYHPRIKFTKELETNNRLNFLDITIIKKKNGKLITNWYRKEISSGRYLHFSSNTNLKYKTSVITALVDRAYLLSNHTYLQNNLEFIHNTLLKNGYPEKFITNNITSRMCKLRSRNTDEYSENNNVATNNKIFSVIPYNSLINYGVVKILKHSNIQIANSSLNSTKFLFTNIKDKTLEEDKKNIIYKIECAICNKFYIGESSQPLKKRIYQHNYHCKLKNPDHSALTRHHCNTGHVFKFKEAKIEKQVGNWHQRLLQESLLININKNKSINSKTDFKNNLKFADKFLGNFNLP